MTISLSSADFWHLATKIPPPAGVARPSDPSESFWAMPTLNRGYSHNIELGAGLNLILWQEVHFEDTEILCPTRSHPWIELSILLEGD
jgi:hypothetical protein